MDKIKKVFSPGKDKDDDIMYGTPSKGPTSTTDPSHAAPTSTLETKPDAEQKDKGVFRQIFNPGGDKYSEQSYGTTATAPGIMADQLQKEPASSEPLKGPETAQVNNDQVKQMSDYSTGSGTTATGPSTMAREDKQDDVSNATYTARSYALGSGSSTDQRPTSSNVDQATQAATDLGSSQPPRENAGRRLDHSLAGAGVGGAGAGYVEKDELDEFMRHGRDSEADQATYRARDYYVGSSSDADPFQRPGHELYSADKGPAGVQSAGEMAPGHVPGEFPAEDGGDVHNKSSGVGTGAATAAGLGAGAAGTGVAGAAATKAYGDHNTTESSKHPGGSAYPPEQSGSNAATGSSTAKSEEGKSGGFKGALAAATAAMGLGGAGAYAASQDDKSDPSSKTSNVQPSTQDARSVGTSNTGPTSSSTTQPEQNDHSTRNAALGAGGLAGAGAGAYALGTSNDDPSSANADNVPSNVSNATQKYHRSHPGDNDSNLRSSSTAGSSNQPFSSSQAPTSSQAQQPEESHTARNTALGAGAATAVGAGAYALSDRGGGNADNAQSSVSPETQKYYKSHPSDRDSNLQSSTPTRSESEQMSTEDHTARNAALGTGAASATGAGAYALSNNSSNGSGNAQSVVSPETQNYYKSHPSDKDSNLQGSTTSTSPSQTQDASQSQQPTEDHTARNAALGAGALGATGAGAYALSNSGNSDSTNPQSVVSPETQKYTRSHPGDSNPAYQSSTTTTASPSSKPQPSASPQDPRDDDHTARNAALGAGAVGAAGAGAYALDRDDKNDQSNAQSVVSNQTRDYAGTHPTDSASKASAPVSTSKKSEPAPASKSLAPATTSKPTTTSDYSRSAAQPEEDHTARNIGLGAAGVGATGAGAYALSRDDNAAPRATSGTTSHMPSQSQQPLTSMTSGTSSHKYDDSTMESTALGAGHYDDGSAVPPQQEDHTTRNAAMGAAGVGAAGAGAYGMSRAGDGTGPASKTIGPHESNVANVMDPRVKPEPTQQFQKTTAGPHESNFANKLDRHVESDPAKVQQEQEGRNYGRDAAIAGGAGAAGAAGYGGYQYANRDPANEYSQPPHVRDTTPPQQQSERDPRIAADSRGHNKLHKKSVEQEERQSDDHSGRNAALGAGGVAGAGAAGYGAKEYYDNKSDSQGTTDSQEREKKHGLMHKIFHPREHKREKEEEERRRSQEASRGSYEQSPAGAAVAPAVATGPGGADEARGASVTEPHTGLPMNVGKYGYGAGGTDGSGQIEGYHADRTEIIDGPAGGASSGGVAGETSQRI